MDTAAKPSNYNDQLQSIYRNIILHQHNMAFTNYFTTLIPAIPATTDIKPGSPSATTSAVLSTPVVPSTLTVSSIPAVPIIPAVPTTPAVPIIKIEPGLSDNSTVSSSPPVDTSIQKVCPISLDTEIPRHEIEGDIEVIMVKSFKDSLKQLETTLNGLRGKKFGYRELLEMSQSRPTYASNGSTTKRNRATSVGSVGSLQSVKTTASHHEDENDAKKLKFNTTVNSTINSTDEHDTSFASDDGRLVIDWQETEAVTAKKDDVHPIKQEPEIVTESRSVDNEYKPWTLRFERLKNFQKKRPKFNVENVDLTYHSNMARRFPGTENRTQEQQQRRDKNTLAARVSRNKNKIYERILDNQSVAATVENISLKRQIACLRVYANSLMKLSGLADTDFSKMWEANIKEMLFDEQNESS